MYRPIAYRMEEECDFSCIYTYQEALVLGREYYPSGYNIEMYDEENDDFIIVE